MKRKFSFKTFWSKALICLAAAAMLTGFAGCDPNEIGTESTVTGVTVSPATATVERGGTQTFTATVIGTDNPKQDVTWMLEGAQKSATTLVAGLLTVAADETATMLTVTAISVQELGQFGIAAVIITGESGGEDEGEGGGEGADMSKVPYIDYYADVRALYDQMAPGIYIYDDKKLYAKGTDGSWFYTEDINTSRYGDVPKFWPANFNMSDGDKREAFIDAVYLDPKNYATSEIQYIRSMSLYPASADMYSRFTRTGIHGITFASMPLALNTSSVLLMSLSGQGSWEILEGQEIAGQPTKLYRFQSSPYSNNHDYYVATNGVCLRSDYGSAFVATYVDTEAGNMNFMLRKIAALLDERCAATIVDFDNMLRQDTYVGNQWRNDWYPEAITATMLPVYPGKLAIETFTVNRFTNTNLPDHVGFIEATGTEAVYSEVLAYIARLKQLTPKIEDRDGTVYNAGLGSLIWIGLADYCKPVDPHELGEISNNYEWRVILNPDGYLTIRYTIITISHL
jgi:hypothetical protein